MPLSGRFLVTKVEIWPVDIPITDPFVVATGQLVTAQNLFIRITLKDGSCGYGEVAPFPDVTGEDRTTSFTVAKDLAAALVGKSASHFRQLARELRDRAPSNPASRCGVEIALVDALCRSARLPLWALWGGADVRERETDITIPITDIDRTLVLARTWYQKGFRIFKMKVGMDGDQDTRRVEAIHKAFPNVAFIIDPNQGFSREQALEFATSVQKFGGQILLLEQPLPKHDLEGLALLRRSLNIPVAADESVQSMEDAKAVIREQAVDFINIKITKSGLLEALEIASFTRASGLRLMIGGMVETRVAMGCSFSLVLGLGGFEVLDLDTPLLLSQDPVKGGYSYTGPRLNLWQGPGLDLEVEAAKGCITIE